MNGDVVVHLRHVDGALIRMLGLAERRGYFPISVRSDLVSADTSCVRLTVRSDRPLEQLIRQLKKLYDVKRVETV